MKSTKTIVIGLLLLMAMFITAVAFASHSISRQSALDNQQNNSQNTNTGNKKKGNKNSNMANMSNMNMNSNTEPNTNGTPRQ